MIAVLAVLAIPVAFLSGGVAFNAWRSGEIGMAAKAAAVFGACILIFAVAPKGDLSLSRVGNCYTDWDGRNNPTVCD